MSQAVPTGNPSSDLGLHFPGGDRDRFQYALRQATYVKSLPDSITDVDSFLHYADAQGWTVRDRERLLEPHNCPFHPIRPYEFEVGDVIDLEPIIRKFSGETVDEDALIEAQCEAAEIEAVEFANNEAVFIVHTDQGVWAMPANSTYMGALRMDDDDDEDD